MANKEHVNIVKHIPLDDLENYIENPRKSLAPILEEALGHQNADAIGRRITDVELERIVERLKAIRLRYLGYSVAETGTILDVNRQSIYNWQDSWNNGGLLALMPGFDGGAPSKLDKEKKQDLIAYVDGREMSTDAVMDYIHDAYGVDYSKMQVSRILRAGGLRYCRGYKVDHRHKDGSIDDLKKTSDWYWTSSETTISSSGSTMNRRSAQTSTAVGFGAAERSSRLIPPKS